MSDIDHWRDTIATLAAQREAGLKRESQLAGKRRRVSLKALTGDAGASKLLSAYGRETVETKTRIEDLSSAIDEATQQLAEAEAAAERAAEGERLKRLRDLAEQRIALAPAIDDAAKKLGELLAENERLASAMVAERHLDTGHHRRCGTGAEIAIALGSHLAPWVEGTGRSDPRFGRALSDLTKDKLAAFLLSDAGIERAVASGPAPGSQAEEEAAAA